MARWVTDLLKVNLLPSRSRLVQVFFDIR